MRVFDYKLLQALDEVVSRQSFESAAQTLNLTQSAISQRIKQLESVVSQPVLIRGQTLEPTSAGKYLLAHFRQVHQLEHDLMGKILPEEPHTSLPVNISVNADTLATWFIPALAPLLKQYPIDLNLQVINENSSHEAIKRGEVFGAISAYDRPIPGCNMDLIGDVDYLMVCSPEFKDRYFSDGVTRSSLLLAPGMACDARDQMHADYVLDVFGVEKGRYRCHTVKTSEAMVTMTEQGVAYGLIPEIQVREQLRKGTLIELTPDDRLVETLYWHRWLLEKGLYKKLSEAIISYGQSILRRL